MKRLIVLVLVGVTFLGWRQHEKSVATAEALARAQALEESAAQAAEERALREREVQEQENARLEREKAALAQAAADAAARLPAMAISRVLEPLIMNLQAPLDPRQPADLVPVLELTKQRILDKAAGAELQRQPIYERATAAMDQLTALAEDRTDFLEELLRKRASSGTMLNRPAAGPSSDLFTQNTTKRWEETVARTKPAILQLMEQLRAAEREWNKQLPPYARAESYDVHSFTPLLIPADQVSPNPLTSGSKSASGSTATRIWRRPYYNLYGYRYPTFY